MAENYYSILTSIGKAQIANAIGLGTQIDFVKMKVGDGNGSYYNPTESQVDLVHTVWEGAIGHVAIDEENPNWINIEVLIPPDVGGFMIREYGVFDGNNNMLGIAKCPETYKPLPADGSTKELNMKFVLAVTNTSSVTLKIDPTILFAKKKDVDVVQNQVNTIATEIQNARGAFQNLKARLDDSDTSLSDLVYQAAGGTATAITLTINGTLKTGYPITFIASANNGGAATTINGKKLFKPATTIAPNLIGQKAYTVWYNSTGDNGNGCFFIKASAEGTALASQVPVGTTFSNDNDTGIAGTAPIIATATITPGTSNIVLAAGSYLNGAQTIVGDADLISANIKAGINIFGVVGATNVVDTTISSNAAVAANVRAGYKCYVNGALVTGTATEKAAATYNPSTVVQTITSGQYLTGTQTIAAITGTATDPDVVAGKTYNSAAGILRTGTATISSLGGRRVASGSQPATGNIGATFTYINGTTSTGNGYLTVTGLSFKPSYIYIKAVNGSYSYVTVYEEIGIEYPKLMKFFITNIAGYNTTTYNFKGDVGSASVYDGGFTLMTSSGYTMNWIAFE